MDEWQSKDTLMSFLCWHRKFPGDDSCALNKKMQTTRTSSTLRLVKSLLTPVIQHTGCLTNCHQAVQEYSMRNSFYCRPSELLTHCNADFTPSLMHCLFMYHDSNFSIYDRFLHCILCTQTLGILLHDYFP